MQLNPGSRLGPYEIVSALGAGGMGAVYRARDTKLGRDVAIKILPDTFAADAERLARFEREARTLASLNHPHIAQIYGVEDRALILELVEGDDLSAVIARGALPLDDALAVARQIALALEGAHDAGVIHRDLKPANIKVRPDGTVKVLDFGLAKTANDSSASDGSALTSPATTGLGVILGTAAYMSPEQARGRPVDRRSDLWAFGVVLFEMLTGRRMFGGDTITDVIAAVVTREPDWSALPVDHTIADSPIAHPLPAERSSETSARCRGRQTRNRGGPTRSGQWTRRRRAEWRGKQGITPAMAVAARLGRDDHRGRRDRRRRVWHPHGHRRAASHAESHDSRGLSGNSRTLARWAMGGVDLGQEDPRQGNARIRVPGTARYRRRRSVARLVAG